MLRDIVQRIAEIEERATAKTTFGDPIREHGRTLVPVAKVSFGFGVGGGQSRRQGDAGQESPGHGRAGGAGRLRVSPVAILEVSENGTKTHPIVDVTRLAVAGMAVVAWNVFWISLTVRTLARMRR